MKIQKILGMAFEVIQLLGPPVTSSAQRAI